MTCARGERRATYGWRRRCWTGRLGRYAGQGKRLRLIDINIYIHRYNLQRSSQFAVLRKTAWTHVDNEGGRLGTGVAGRVEGVGVLPLPLAIRFADGLASVRMTFF